MEHFSYEGGCGINISRCLKEVLAWAIVKYFLNQVRVSRRPACAWFLEIAFVCDVGMCVNACV